MLDESLTKEEVWLANRGAAIQKLYASGLSQEEIELILNPTFPQS